MMYRHMIDECLNRAYRELAVYKKYNRQEDADHVQRRIDSLLRLREDAPKAANPPQGYEPISPKPSLKDILADLKGF